MFLIKKRKDKTFIKDVFVEPYAYFAFVAFIFCALSPDNIPRQEPPAFYEGFFLRVLVFFIVWLVGLTIYFILSALTKSNNLAELIFDWHKKMLIYKTKKGKINEIPLKEAKIICAMQEIQVWKQSPAYLISFYLLNKNGEEFTLEVSNYHSGIKLVQFFYDLHQKHILSLDKIGQFLAQKPVYFFKFYRNDQRSLRQIYAKTRQLSKTKAAAQSQDF